jgi:hypothetical protein
MPRKFDELRNRISPERRQRNAADARRAFVEMAVQELGQDIGNPTEEGGTA